MDDLQCRLLIVGDQNNDPRKSVDDLLDRSDDEYELVVTASNEDALALINNPMGGVFEYVFIDADCEDFGSNETNRLLSALILAFNAIKSGVSGVAVLTSRRKEDDVMIKALIELSSVSFEQRSMAFIAGQEADMYIDKETFVMREGEHTSEEAIKVKNFSHAFSCLIYPA